MSVKLGEYHPYAACLMFRGCRSSDTVRANLKMVTDSYYAAGMVEGRRRHEVQQQRASRKAVGGEASVWVSGGPPTNLEHLLREVRA